MITQFRNIRVQDMFSRFQYSTTLCAPGNPGEALMNREPGAPGSSEFFSTFVFAFIDLSSKTSNLNTCDIVVKISFGIT